jgi:predicted  nucleic acid-binding Zn-ribbon protein
MTAGKSAPRRDMPPIEGEIRDLVRHEASRQDPAKDSEPAANNVANIIQRIAGTSVTEIDRLITELTQLRDHLESEGKRVEAEIAAFAQFGHAAVNSIREINQTIGRFKRTTQLNETQ